MNFVERYIKENKLLLEGIAVVAGLVALFWQVPDDNAKIFTALLIIILIFLVLSLGAKTIVLKLGIPYFLVQSFVFSSISASLIGLLCNLYLKGLYYIFLGCCLIFYIWLKDVTENLEDFVRRKLESLTQPLMQTHLIIRFVVRLTFFMLVPFYIAGLGWVILYALPELFYQGASWFEDSLKEQGGNELLPLKESLFIFGMISFILSLLMKWIFYRESRRFKSI